MPFECPMRLRRWRRSRRWCRPRAAQDCDTLELLRGSGAIHVDLDRVRVAVARRNARALGRRPGLGPLHLDDGTLGEVDVALLGQRRGADLDVEEQAITLLEHEGMKMR